MLSVHMTSVLFSIILTGLRASISGNYTLLLKPPILMCFALYNASQNCMWNGWTFGPYTTIFNDRAFVSSHHKWDMRVSLSLQWALGHLICNLGKNVESVLALVKMELTNCLTVLIRSTKSTLLPFKMVADAPCTVCSHRFTCWVN